MIPKIVNAPYGLNVRQTPSATGVILKFLSKGSGGISLLSDPPNVSDATYVWQAVALSDRRLGWAVTTLAGVQTLVDAAPPQPTASRYGLHILSGGHSNDTIALCKRLADAGKKITVLVAGEKPLALALLPNVRTCIYRPMNVPPYSPDYDPDPAKAYATGRQWVRDRVGTIADLPANIIIQYANEGKWSPTEADFWNGVLDQNDGVRKLALYADAIGNPDDEGGTTAEQKWLTRIPLLKRAMFEGHIYAFHVYSAPGTPPGMLTEITGRHDYETRFRRFKAITPADAQIPFVVTEAGREYVSGSFDGIPQTVNWLKMLNQEYANDGIPVCAYTVGVWKSSSIDGALPALETLFASRSL